MRRKAFLDRGGILRVITPCPPLHLEELLACWQLAIQMLGDRCLQCSLECLRSGLDLRDNDSVDNQLAWATVQWG